jgi:uncharacterized delta-60 repeat protein
MIRSIKNYMKKIILFLFSLSIFCNVFGQPGTLDPVFGTRGVIRTDLSDHFDQLSALRAVQQKDGKLVVLFTGRGYSWLARYYSNGTPDLSFPLNSDTHRFFLIDQAIPKADLVLQRDGRLLIAESSYGDNLDFGLYRIGANGDFFTSENIITSITSGQRDSATALALQPDGKILEVGTTSAGTHWNFAVVRFKTDLTPDSTFSSDGKLTTDFSSGNDVALSVVVQKDGKILVGGYTTTPGSTKKDFAIARYTSNGTLDNSFSGDGKLTTDFGNSDGILKDLALQSDGKILLAVAPSFTLVRLKPNGALDTAFAHKGWTTPNFIPSIFGGYSSLAPQPDGKIIAGGTANGSFAIARYKSNGTLDSTFAVNGLQLTTSISGQSLPDPNSLGNLISALQIQGNRLYAAGWSLTKGDAMATLAAYDLDLGSFVYCRDVDQDGYGNSAKSLTAPKQP